NMARVLIERETIYTEEVDMLMEGKSVEEILKYMDEEDAKHVENAFKKYEAEPEEKPVDGKKDGGDDGEKNIRF
ncbi:MAG: hypothetical protein K2I29_01495, partial [Clostridia bacterium]|nr:hypothetical protein [Clostridia bacterium]